jgi:hypothetical protein
MKIIIGTKFLNFRLVTYIQSSSGAPQLDLTSFPAAAQLKALLQQPINQLEQQAHAHTSSSNTNN